MHKIVRPNLRNQSFPSSNFAEDYKGKEERTRQCMNYGEAASAITIAVDIGHLFKKFFVAPAFKNKTRYTPYMSLESQISYIATNRGNINRQCLTYLV